MTYLVRHWLAAVASPPLLAVLVAAVALVFHLRHRAKVSRRLLVCAAALAYAGCTAIAGNALLAPLERLYPPLPQDQSLPMVDAVVVLGSSFRPRDAVPITAALDPEGVVRIVEGVRLVRKIPGSRLVVSGGAPERAFASARGYAKLAHDLGIPDTTLTMLDEGLNTAQEARAIAAALRREPFLLVTSASHMPRAMLLLERAGARPIPAPTGQIVVEKPLWELGGWLPSANGLAKCERALHEYLGLASIAMHLE